MSDAASLMMGGIALLLSSFAGGCGAKTLPEANEQQAAIAARECGLTRWEWSSEIYEFDGEPEYPDHKGIAFTLDATGLDDAGLQKTLDETDRMEACLQRRLAAQGVGTNIVGGAAQTGEDKGEKENVPSH